MCMAFAQSFPLLGQQKCSIHVIGLKLSDFHEINQIIIAFTTTCDVIAHSGCRTFIAQVHWERVCEACARGRTQLHPLVLTSFIYFRYVCICMSLNEIKRTIFIELKTSSKIDTHILLLDRNHTDDSIIIATIK